MQHVTEPLLPASLIGTFRRFGDFGPAYEIIGIASEDKEKGILFNVRVVDSGEGVQYSYRDAVNDPEA